MNDFRSPYRDSQKPPLRPVCLIMLAAVLGSGLFGSTACAELAALSPRQCADIAKFATQDKIEWLGGPNVDAGSLVMRGRVVGDAQIHDATTKYDDNSSRAAFALLRVGEKVEWVAAIFPESMSQRVRSAGAVTVVFADTYNISSDHSNFHIRAELPAHLVRALNSDIQLAVAVSEQDPHLLAALGIEPLGISCINGDDS